MNNLTGKQQHKYPYEWTLKKSNFKKNKGSVFSCFASGGGSSLGYKIKGFDVIGMNEIDKKVADCYIENHDPKYPYIEDIRTFKDRTDLPEELYHLDILDGSPPCSSFSMSGNREQDWAWWSARQWWSARGGLWAHATSPWCFQAGNPSLLRKLPGKLKMIKSFMVAPSI